MIRKMTIIGLGLLFIGTNVSALNKDLLILNNNLKILSNEKLEQFQDLKIIDLKKDFKLGSKDNFLIEVKKELDLKENNTNIFDIELENKIKEKQLEFGFNENGILDNKTWYALKKHNKDFKEEKLKDAELNWNNILNISKEKNFKRIVVVNIPNQTLKVFLKNESMLDYVLDEEFKTNIIVGKLSTPTPIMDFEVIGIKYNPTWTPTGGMLKRSVLKKDGINKKWITDHKLNAYDENNNKLDIAELDSLSGVRLVQSAGNSNALGLLKFETNSKENIYLHDTNERHLFKNNTRLYSSGCIRVNNYVELATILSGYDTNIINEKIKKGKTIIEKTPEKIPVFIDYSQVFITEKGEVLFSPNVYGLKKD